MCCVMQSSASSLVFTFCFCPHLLLPTLCPNSHTVLVHPILSRSHSLHMFFIVFSRHLRCGIYTPRRLQYTVVSCKRSNCNKIERTLEHHALKNCSNYLYNRLPCSMSTWLISMVTFTGTRSPPRTLPTPP